jgi:hypothetical protein
VWEQGQLIFYSLDPIRSRGSEVARTNVESAKGFSFVISPDGSRIATEVPHQQIRILDLRSKPENTLPLPHWHRMWNYSWAADGNALFATVSQQMSLSASN